jgi:ubiquinone/menaquinone biosynthesis C-methylase UbiE
MWYFARQKKQGVQNVAENPTQKFYDRISHVYDAIADGGEHQAREKGLELLNIRPKERVLEIGFGTGHSLISLAEAVSDGGHVDGVDISAGMRDVAQARVTKQGLDARVTLKVADVPPLPYEDDTFDAVCMSFTLELFALDVIPEVLRETRRVLRNGGRLGVVSMATTTLGEKDSLLEQTYKWMHQHFPHIVDCQPIPVEKFLADAGFTLEQVDRLSLFTMPVVAAGGVNRQ